MGVLTTQRSTQHREMSGVTWRDIPITRININMREQEQTRKQPGKRVTWNENLLDIKTISPRVKTDKDKFRFPSQLKPSTPSCSHFICKPGQPCRNKRSESPGRNKRSEPPGRNKRSELPGRNKRSESPAR